MRNSHLLAGYAAMALMGAVASAITHHKDATPPPEPAPEPEPPAESRQVRRARERAERKADHYDDVRRQERVRMANWKPRNR